MKVIGIDFGHGETSAGYVDSETVVGNEIVLRDLYITGENFVIPSVICKMESGEYVISPSSKQIAEAQDFGVCFKAPLIGSENYQCISNENRVFFREFLALTYKAIYSNGNNPLFINNGIPNFVVYVACPSGWNSNQIDAYKNFLTNECCIPVASIIKESRAAYIASRRKVGGGIRTQKGNVLVIDFGSSTVDFTFFNNNLKFEPIHAGYPLGASYIENAFLNHLKGLPNSNNAENIELVYDRVGNDTGKNLLLFEIRRQKEEYFKKQDHDFFVLSIALENLFFDRSLRGRYIESPSEDGFSKKQVEEILKDYITDLSKMLDSFKLIKGVGKVDKVILTGGASRMFFFTELVANKFGVSKEADTLIIDQEASLTISEGIAAFGYMNERSELAEKPLWEDVDRFINNDLEKLLRSSIERSVGDMYIDEFSKITKAYSKGEICKDGKHNLDALEDANIELLNSWSSNPSIMDNKIQKSVEESLCKSINKTLSEFAGRWGLGKSDVDISFPALDLHVSLTSEACNYVNKYIWITVREFINSRDWFFGWTDDSPYKDRDYDDRNSISNAINSGLKKYFSDLEYPEPLAEEVKIIATAIRTSVKDFVDEAKLEQYR